MRIQAVFFGLVVVGTALIAAQANAVTVQTAGNVFDGMPYLYVEAENYSSITDNGTTGNGWKVVSKESPITSVQGVDILPASSNVSGTALLDDNGGGNHEDTVRWEMQFITPGTYQFFMRHTMFDANGNGTVGNEDSVFLSPAFNKNSESDWVGFEGLNFDENDINADIPNPGFPLDPVGYKTATSDSSSDGWFALRDWGVKSAGSVDFSQNASPLFNGNFHWYNRPVFVDTNSGGGFTSDYGFKTEYIVTPEMVGQTLTFEIGNREPYVAIDGFLFIQTGEIYPNSDVLDLHTQAELDAVLPVPVDGDYNGDGKVDAADYVLWRNDPGAHGGDPAGYNAWRANFGAGSGLGSSAAVPEPASIGLVLIALAAGSLAWNRRGK